MPSFDVVSEVDMHEVTNSVDQAKREVGTRFDFKGSGATYEQNGAEIIQKASSEFQLKQMLDILQMKLSKRGINIACMEIKEPVTIGKEARQTIILQQGLDAELSRKIVKLTKEAKLKVQAAIQGEKVRITGKNRDDLQQTIALLRDAKLDMPLQFDNFRD